jgi:hypothetical protein
MWLSILGKSRFLVLVLTPVFQNIAIPASQSGLLVGKDIKAIYSGKKHVLGIFLNQK